MNKIKVASYFILSVIGGLMVLVGFVLFFTYDEDSVMIFGIGWMFFFLTLPLIGMGITYYGVSSFKKEFQKGQNVDLDEMKDGDLMEKF